MEEGDLPFPQFFHNNENPVILSERLIPLTGLQQVNPPPIFITIFWEILFDDV